MFETFLHNSAMVQLLWLLLGTAAIDTLSGVYSAWAGGTFSLKFLDSFIPDHLLRRIFPILITAAGSALTTGDVSSTLFVAAGVAVAAYEASTVKSVLENLSAATAKSGNVPDSV